MGKFSGLFNIGGGSGAGDAAIIITDDKKDLTPLPSSTLMESDVYSNRKTPSETDTLGGMKCSHSMAKV